MRLLAVALCLLIASAIPLSGGSNVALATMASTVKLDIIRGLGRGSCTAFAINQRQSYFLTANHCIGDEVLIRGDRVKVIYQDQIGDLAVLAVGDTMVRRTEALRFAAATPPPNTPISMIGYAHGWDMPLHIAGKVEAPFSFFNIAPYLFYTFFTPACIGGMSGGPIVNAQGEVVSIIQMTSAELKQCVGRPVQSIRMSVGQYWEVGKGK